MEFDAYFEKVEKLAAQIEASEKSTHEYLDYLISIEDYSLYEIIIFRREFISDVEETQVSGYLDIGFFNQLQGADRIACFVVNFEIDEILTTKSWKRRCEKYTTEQPLFRSAPKLMEHVRKKENGNFDMELLDYGVFEHIDNSEILKYENLYTNIDFSLNPMIVEWTRDSFRDSPLFIRVDPYKVFDKAPKRMLLESILVPANPNWWKNLAIHNRTKDGAAYMLEDCSPKDNIAQYWEFHVKNIARLEVIVSRDNNGNLSLMLEELTRIDKGKRLLGRMIHLDTDSRYGEDFNKSILNHMDLAINIYDGDHAKKRFDEYLSNGNKTVDASYRTHLLRVEKIPFKGMFGYAYSFLKSKVLVNEWLSDQFKE